MTYYHLFNQEAKKEALRQARAEKIVEGVGIVLGIAGAFVLVRFGGAVLLLIEMLLRGH